jgi:hypothetical protein
MFLISALCSPCLNDQQKTEMKEYLLQMSGQSWIYSGNCPSCSPLLTRTELFLRTEDDAPLFSVLGWVAVSARNALRLWFCSYCPSHSHLSHSKVRLTNNRKTQKVWKGDGRSRLLSVSCPYPGLENRAERAVVTLCCFWFSSILPPVPSTPTKSAERIPLKSGQSN